MTADSPGQGKSQGLLKPFLEIINYRHSPPPHFQILSPWSATCKASSRSKMTQLLMKVHIKRKIILYFRLAGLIRQHLANDNGIRATSTERYVNGGGGQHSIKTSSSTQENEHTSPTTNGNADLEPMDYRCVSQTKLQHHQIEVRKN